MNASSLHPTVWRTCRVLANSDRLRLFAALTRKQPQTVSALAEQAGLSLSKTSMHLRAMESRGLLSVRRFGRTVEYQTSPTNADSGVAELLKTLKELIKSDEKTIAKIIHLATGFTHPARIEAYRKIAADSGSMDQLMIALKLSSPAVARHLKKLLARGYIAATHHRYEVARHSDAVGRALAEMALR